jgi:hypothetical protein
MMEMRKGSLVILIHPHDNVVVLTKNGEFYGILAASEQEIRENADLIEEEMTKVMKKEECRQGVWIFKIRHNWLEVRGEKLPFIDEQGDEHESN